jgi:S-adenosyl-L-methionine hydrolase (adenosine-forming)
MAIVTLISDWNQNDYYIASVKGKILSQCPDTTFVDISHNVPAFDIAHAAFILKNCFANFPAGTVHIVAVRSVPEKNGHFVIVKYHDQYFISADNGIFGLVFDELPQEVVVPESKGGETFPELTVFVEAVCNIINQKKSVGQDKKPDSIKKQVPVLPAIDENLINGSVIYVDSYRNAVTNITKDIFDRIGKGRNYEILVQSNHYRISRISKTYDERSSGEIIALFNNSGFLEIAIQYGNAAELLNLDVSSSVRIKFNDLNLKNKT